MLQQSARHSRVARKTKLESPQFESETKCHWEAFYPRGELGKARHLGDTIAHVTSQKSAWGQGPPREVVYAFTRAVLLLFIFFYAFVSLFLSQIIHKCLLTWKDSSIVEVDKAKHEFPSNHHPPLPWLVTMVNSWMRFPTATVYAFPYM